MPVKAVLRKRAGKSLHTCVCPVATMLLLALAVQWKWPRGRFAYEPNRTPARGASESRTQCYLSIPWPLAIVYSVSAIHSVCDALKNFLDGTHAKLRVELVERPLPAQCAVWSHHPARGLVFCPQDVIRESHHFRHAQGSVRLIVRQARFRRQPAAQS